jgi:hypothetical protein
MEAEGGYLDVVGGHQYIEEESSLKEIEAEDYYMEMGEEEDLNGEMHSFFKPENLAAQNMSGVLT